MSTFRLLAVFSLIASVGLLSACSKDPAKIKDGAYTASDVKGVDDKTAAMIKTVTMTLERGNMRASFTMEKGKIDLAARQTILEKWPAGCGHALELMKFGSPLTLESLSLSSPVLVAGCPVESGNVVMREAGKIDGDDPCDGTTGPCITWSPK
jgi:hypothetical protein